ncbi:hypothetical protein LX36DRAFT_658107 [Colletotrichum falcatum]|nr:hypothetical protein LX36DRAFT_658107 [Colletotrichum falcatum]
MLQVGPRGGIMSPLTGNRIPAPRSPKTGWATSRIPWKPGRGGSPYFPPSRPSPAGFLHK